MAGFSQGAGIGLALANWIVDGDPGDDVFGMDLTRFGPFATDDAYLRSTTAQFYARRFLIAYPNEELPAGRPLKTSPVHPDLGEAGAHFSVVYGLEVAQYFAPSRDFEENLTWRRSNAHRSSVRRWRPRALRLVSTRRPRTRATRSPAPVPPSGSTT